MIHNLQKVFGSIIKSLEILYVIENAKPCARILVFEDDTGKVVKFLNENELKFLISDFKVVKQNLQSEYYSDKSIKIPKGANEKGYFIFYISKNKIIAEKAKSAEAGNNHLDLGLLLGYPKCCCDFFENNFNDNNADLTLNILKISNGYEFPFYTNIAARHFDASLLSHFPCSFKCDESIKIAKNNLKMIKMHSKQLAALFSGVMRGVVVYTSYEGVHILRKHEKIDDKIIYCDVMTTSRSKLYHLLSSNKQLKIIDKNNFVVNDENLQGSKYGVMVFI